MGNGRGREGHADVLDLLDLRLSNKDYTPCHPSVAGAGAGAHSHAHV